MYLDMISMPSPRLARVRSRSGEREPPVPPGEPPSRIKSGRDNVPRRFGAGLKP